MIVIERCDILSDRLKRETSCTFPTKKRKGQGVNDRGGVEILIGHVLS